uniref:Pentatricopeptide repeat-containing protein At1g06270 family n=1 Tax=Cajanus cajan TaxID=3821 RepID=A0A151SAQ7_CAJCA|nr:Pentatricopeptide repeat-containing protein At1g06270 family [Cajanus cajan]
MVMGAAIHRRFLLHFHPILNHCNLGRSVSSLQKLEQAVRVEVEAKNYVKIPDILIPLESCQNSNPFSFFSSFPQNLQVQIVDEMLQSFIPIRPRSKPQLAYSYLLSYTLQSSHPFPLALAVLQRTLRSGCLPVPQTHVLLSSAWLNWRGLSHSVANILLQMQSIGYHPDCGTCNYLLSSLCAVDQLVEAVKVLRAMGGAGCIPDSNSYGTVIGAMCRVRKTDEALVLMQQMVVQYGLTPGQGTLVKLLAALRANREIWKAVEMIEFLEKEGSFVGFESYELVIEGCLEKREYVLAAKVATGMTERGFIPYIRVRQKIIDGLASIDEWKIACAVRQRFAALKS